RIGNGAKMDDRIKLAAVKPPHEFIRRDDVGQTALGQIAPLVSGTHGVIDDNVGKSAVVKGCNKIGADESSSAGDQNHANPLSRGFLAPRYAGMQPRASLGAGRRRTPNSRASTFRR